MFVRKIRRIGSVYNGRRNGRVKPRYACLLVIGMRGEKHFDFKVNYCPTVSCGMVDMSTRIFWSFTIRVAFWNITGTGEYVG